MNLSSIPSWKDVRTLSFFFNERYKVKIDDTLYYNQFREFFRKNIKWKEVPAEQGEYITNKY